MCKFFSFITNPDRDSDVYYFDWDYRKNHLDDKGVDSHSHICAHYKLNEDKCNKWEYNPFSKTLTLDMQNAEKNDETRVRRWLDNLDFKTVGEPLVVKPIINPFDLPAVETVTDEQVGWLKDWVSVRASVWDSGRDSVWDSVRDSVRASVGDSVWHSVWDSVWDAVKASVGDAVKASVGDAVWPSVSDSVWDSVWGSVGAYSSSFFAIKYEYDFTSAIKLWESGLVPSFDGTTWLLHTGKDAHIVYEWTPKEE